MIDSNQNKNIKLINSLKNKKDRDKTGLFVAEGLRFVEEIPSDYEIFFYAVSEEFCKEYDTESLEIRSNVVKVSNKIFKEFSDTTKPQGILAVIKQKKFDLINVLNEAGENSFFIMAEELNDPGNLGTIIRTAEASNCNGVILTKGSVDIYNPKVLRSTMGSIFHLPIITDIELEEGIKSLKEKNISIYAAALDAIDYPYIFDFKKGSAFLIGNEARGLSQKANSLADKLIKIPMPGNAESLNASIAAGILMYEVVRQRLC